MSELVFYVCTCLNLDGNTQCFCLPSFEFSQKFEFHIAHLCKEVKHEHLFNNGYVLNENGQPTCKFDKKKEEGKLLKFPCSAHYMNSCNCVPSYLARGNWKLHSNNKAVHMVCQNEDHKNWYSKEHYLIEDYPGWISSCRLPLGGLQNERVIQLCVLFNVKCCCKERLCETCNELSYHDTLLLPDGKKILLKTIEKLFSFIKWDLIKTKRPNIFKKK